MGRISEETDYKKYDNSSKQSTTESKMRIDLDRIKNGLAYGDKVIANKSVIITHPSSVNQRNHSYSCLRANSMNKQS